MYLIKNHPEYCTKKFFFCVVADDSGLCVDYLNGAPGILSARYAGDNASDEDKYRKLLSELEEVPLEKRSSLCVCCCSCFHDGREFVTRGEWEALC